MALKSLKATVNTDEDEFLEHGNIQNNQGGLVGSILFKVNNILFNF